MKTHSETSGDGEYSHKDGNAARQFSPSEGLQKVGRQGDGRIRAPLPAQPLLVSECVFIISFECCRLFHHVCRGSSIVVFQARCQRQFVCRCFRTNQGRHRQKQLAKSRYLWYQGTTNVLKTRFGKRQQINGDNNQPSIPPPSPDRKSRS